MLVEAIRNLQNEMQDRWNETSFSGCKVVFVGHGPAESEIRAMCASYRIDAVFTGQLTGDDLAASYASADLFAFPSVSETFVRPRSSMI